MVRATRNTRCTPRADNCSLARACASSARHGRSRRQEFCSSCAGEIGIELAGARDLQASRRAHALGGLRAGQAAFGRRTFVQQLLARHRRHRDAQVDAIEQRPGNARAISRDFRRRAAAISRGLSEVTAGTRIHRGDQLEARRIFHLQRGARNGHHAGFERLAQVSSTRAIELRQFIEKQHAAMREAHFAGARLRTAADDGARRRGVVWRAERPLARSRSASKPRVLTEAMDATSSASIAVERRQQARQSLREHALAGARWADQQEAVAAGGGDEQRALGRAPGRVRRRDIELVRPRMRRRCRSPASSPPHRVARAPRTSAQTA